MVHNVGLEITYDGGRLFPFSQKKGRYCAKGVGMGSIRLQKNTRQRKVLGWGGAISLYANSQ